MNNYKIRVSYERIVDVEAESLHEARDIAAAQVLQTMRTEQERSGYNPMSTEQYDEPRDWEKEAKEDGESVAEDLKDEVEEAVRTYKDSKEGDKDAAAEPVEYDSDDVDSIWDDIYQNEDVANHAHEMADGYFIYTHRKGLQEAMDCADELANYASGDSGLWEGVEDYEKVIQIKGYDALSGGILNYAEEAIKAKIAELLGIEA